MSDGPKIAYRRRKVVGTAGRSAAALVPLVSLSSGQHLESEFFEATQALQSSSRPAGLLRRNDAAAGWPHKAAAGPSGRSGSGRRCSVACSTWRRPIRCCRKRGSCSRRGCRGRRCCYSSGAVDGAAHCMLLAGTSVQLADVTHSSGEGVT